MILRQVGTRLLSVALQDVIKQVVFLQCVPLIFPPWRRLLCACGHTLLHLFQCFEVVNLLFELLNALHVLHHLVFEVVLEGIIAAHLRGSIHFLPLPICSLDLLLPLHELDHVLLLGLNIAPLLILSVAFLHELRKVLLNTLFLLAWRALLSGGSLHRDLPCWREPFLALGWR